MIHATDFTLLWIALIVIGIITFLYRAAFIFFMEALRIPDWLQQPLRFVPVAALTAIIVPELLTRNDMLVATWQNERLLAGLVAIGIAWWSRNILLTLGVGMASLYLLQWVGL